MKSAEVKVCKGLLLLRSEDEGFGWRREDRLQPSELAVEVADVHGLLDRWQEGRFYSLGQQGFPVDLLEKSPESE